MARHSPWGSVQNVTTLMRGVSIVGTAGHGGMMIGKGAAARMLSHEAIAVGLNFGPYICYEEDCEINVPLVDSPAIREAFLTALTSPSTSEAVKVDAIKSLSLYRPDFLRRIGETPDPENELQYRLHESYRATRESSPGDVWVIARGEDRTLMNDVVAVEDGNDVEHFVTRASYEASRESQEQRQRMSDLERMPNDSLPPLLERVIPHLLRRKARFEEVQSKGGRNVGVRMVEEISSVRYSVACQLGGREQAWQFDALMPDIEEALSALATRAACNDDQPKEAQSC